MCLQLHDAAGRLHTAELQLPAGFPVSAPAVTVHLPKPFKLKWLPGHTLLQLKQQLQQALDSYQALWAQLEDIDRHTQLLDPPQALAHPYASCSRCIALGNGASCQLQLSAAAPRGMPAVVFHGPSSIVARLQAAWYGGAAQQWDEQQSVRENLQEVLQVQLPAPKPGSKRGCAAAASAAGASGIEQAEAAAGSEADDASDDDYDMAEDGACCICYSLHLPDPAHPDQIGAAPSVTCPGASCSRVFHAMCLAEWLGALPTSRRVFDTLFGSCPFCNGPIGVSTRPAAH
ncbi:hypothetical protein OEZ85_003036 [Tetradesmus obliquus]|uniref:FANCL C-terminal domain-containing protein n=1 Tax=Tetradesmus obliquus TaxID=3088 RepID=A0ABY8TZU6_TETOB|nr:hypothetical protein OEZ85_003036 [Tetradesmus obliquus]